MSSYLIIGIIFVIIFIVSLILLIYFIKDEKYINEVDNNYLISIGKKYTKKELSDALYDQYYKIIMAIVNDDYNYLKDSVSDQEYNNILNELKENNLKNIKKTISNIKRKYVKLIGLNIKNNIEICDVLIDYSCIESEIDLTNSLESIKKENNYSYIVTFVKDSNQSEDFVCPNCGYQNNIVLNSKCIRCDSFILPKTKHWVYVGRKANDLNIKKY